ncbi:LPXTG cell wall anchor domain-containing protein [Streptococcus agalactiae]|uniref:LPXTG cell wall anchor domain-containing protein n=1 Tax=Streptococcus agalactiae TaxID=1311 RepID=UPI0008103AA6|nr:LPXTG cell wall anchor domain-containing protein [Streptococcus agalactiae]OCM11307.1 cell wall anchor protein [Streptococcus agalactiae]HEO1153214.1 LPXTG cell wall anchor domain-containing protein [Streptococcus agalactiae]HEO2219121.1 LPXTG cell wall anchor domain-containing protein [Streptococcus agalactiae]HEO2663490.1 LPXTG cell wall anchor domain-containing protein [Streptococcus agalactiae]
MTKKQLLATLVVSTLALAQAGFVSADELAPIDSSAPTTEVVTPGTSSASTEAKAPAVQPTEPSVTPVDPTAPSDKDNVGSLDGVPADKPAPSDKAQDKDNAGSLDGVPTPSDKPQDKDNAGSLDGVPADKPAPSDKAQDKDNAGSLDGVPDEQPKTTDQANQQGKSQIGTTSTSTGQAVHDITKAPVQTNTGVKIVSTENGLVKLSDGSLVTPEAVGAVTNADKTISVTKADGKKATLPHTGEAQSLLSFLGAALLTVAGYVFRKKQA